MALKAIEKHLANHSFFSNPWLADMIADIEAEIAERYMELPVDADGVPIRIGDMLECNANGYDGKFEVFAVGAGVVIGNHDIEFVTRHPTDWFHVARYCRHVKPRTVEDVLCDMIHEYACTDMTTEQTAAKYAAELRDLLEVRDD